MKETKTFDKLYYEIALIINEELYEENKISPILHRQTEKEILKKLHR